LLRLLQKAGVIDIIGKENFQATFDESLARARAILAEAPAHGSRHHQA